MRPRASEGTITNQAVNEHEQQTHTND
jgi:hypothetical protein